MVPFRTAVIGALSHGVPCFPSLLSAAHRASRRAPRLFLSRTRTSPPNAKGLSGRAAAARRLHGVLQVLYDKGQLHPRILRGLKLPFFQEIRSKHPEAIVDVTITYAEVVSGTHAEEILSVSRRWMTAEDPDPDGEQLKAIKTFLESDKGRNFELVWIDAASMPQDQPEGSRSAPDTDDFKTMISQARLPLKRRKEASLK